MRKDMKDVIVSGHSRHKDAKRSQYRTRDLEDLPDRERMREGYPWREPHVDNLNPLFNYLRTNVGRPWSKVYQEICEVADIRNFAGKHLREHIEWMVISEEKLRAKLQRRWWYGGRNDFYYDTEGVLRECKDSRRYSYKPRRDPDECEIKGQPYLRINNCWFEARYAQVTDSREEYCYLSRQRITRHYEKRVTLSVRQLNKKELKALRLSNEPGWKWYERKSA